MQNPILEVKNLIKKYGSFTAVNNISFSIKEGEILGLLGKNGAGKTTTIQILLGVNEETEGKILYFGKDFKTNREEILKNINFSSTYINLPWYFTVTENLEVQARLYEIPNKKKRINKLLEEFEIEHLAKKQFYMLSAGERTRLLLTKAFLNYPKLILLDEPTASLDPEVAIKVREFLKKERKEYNVSILFTSHNMSEVEEICDKIIILDHGKIINEDTPENLRKKISKCELELVITKDYKKALTFFEKNKINCENDKFLFIITLEEKNISKLLYLLSKENISYQEISINKPTLEDYFLQTTG